MSAKIGGVQTPPPPFVSHCQNFPNHPFPLCQPLSATQKPTQKQKKKNQLVADLKYFFVLFFASSTQVYNFYPCRYLLCTLPGRRPRTAKSGERARPGRVLVIFVHFSPCTYKIRKIKHHLLVSTGLLLLLHIITTNAYFD